MKRLQVTIIKKRIRVMKYVICNDVKRGFLTSSMEWNPSVSAAEKFSSFANAHEWLKGCGWYKIGARVIMTVNATDYRPEYEA